MVRPFRAHAIQAPARRRVEWESVCRAVKAQAGTLMRMCNGWCVASSPDTVRHAAHAPPRETACPSIVNTTPSHRRSFASSLSSGVTTSSLRRRVGHPASDVCAAPAIAHRAMPSQCHPFESHLESHSLAPFLPVPLANSRRPCHLPDPRTPTPLCALLRAGVSPSVSKRSNFPERRLSFKRSANIRSMQQERPFDAGSSPGMRVPSLRVLVKSALPRKTSASHMYTLPLPHPLDAQIRATHNQDDIAQTHFRASNRTSHFAPAGASASASPQYLTSARSWYRLDAYAVRDISGERCTRTRSTLARFRNPRTSDHQLSSCRPSSRQASSPRRILDVVPQRCTPRARYTIYVRLCPG
ncbi:hypothetical protein B0H15DRAFT_988571 [Mycena belliarum]|uniref:Uncharacterized protein n=1 Tax=Mycena belliarum TaxID=1033014 RepID=A0AAD6U506_9AGAR|nr:hypothetical protein B0H15DRAFT_988571 [Mycena belliae]